jgi:hypothetical protein
MGGEDTIPCKFCGENILASARKCRFCNEFQTAEDRAKLGPRKVVPGGETFAPCYNCGNTTAKRLTWSWWGGVLGPKLLTHVECFQCGTRYNGKSGHSNTMNIVAYQVVIWAVLIGIGVFASMGVH